MPRRPLALLILVAALGLAIYLIASGLRNGSIPVLPEGPQTLTGTLVPASLSLTRRGTHIVKVDGEDVAYAESAVVNLRTYELTDAILTGTYYLNTEPHDLPVLVVSSIRPIEIPAQEVDLPPVGLTLRVPLTWDTELFDDGVAFTLTGTTTPLLRVVQSALTQLPAGTPMFVAGRNAVRIEGEDDTQTVHVIGPRGILTFSWTPPDDDPSLMAAFAQMLRTAVVRGSTSSATQTGSVRSTPSSRPSGSAASIAPGQPCGGPAGVLCPAGSFCSVTGADGVGTCVPLR